MSEKTENGLWRALFLLWVFLTTSPAYASGYSQQEVNYKIQVQLNDSTHFLSGFEELTYINHSPDTLRFIYFHLWPNAYKDENTVMARLRYRMGESIFSDRSVENGYIDSLDFKVDGNRVQLSYLIDTIDIAVLNLPTPLAPGKRMVITTPFRVKIPSASISRLGHEGQSYYITQWYPKPAVYEFGKWKYMPYMDWGEFYSEFGSYDVSITLPSNYVVGSSGILLDESERLFLKTKDEETRAGKDTVETNLQPPSSREMKTLHFKQEHIHDFAWFADKQYHVLKEDVTLPSGKKIETWSLFTNREYSFWLDASKYIRQSLQHFSEWYGEYPYSSFTAIDAGHASGGGMEYPMVVTIGNDGSRAEMEKTIAHEAAHNWFYGVLGSNERQVAWMDEGMTLFSEISYMKKAHAKEPAVRFENFRIHILSKLKRLPKVDPVKRLYYHYHLAARANFDMAPSLSSEKYNLYNYRLTAYTKPALSFFHLQSFMGDSIFNRCMQEYFDRWKFKHPTPSDQQRVFEEVSGKDLRWFYHDLLQTNGKSDYRLSSIRKKNNERYELKVSHSGSFTEPIKVAAMMGDSILESKWMEVKNDTTITFDCSTCTSFLLDPDETSIDLYKENNYLSTSGIFCQTGKPELIVGSGLNSSNKKELYWLPVIGGNVYNDLLAGIALHNVSAFQKKFEYIIMPMYSTGTQDLNGGGQLLYRLFPKGRVYSVAISSGLSSYRTGNPFYESNLRFIKSDNRVTMNFLPSDRSRKIINEIELRHIYLHKRIPESYRIGKAVQLNFAEISFTHKDENPLSREMIKLSLQMNKEFFRSSFEFEKFFNYGSDKKGLNTRFFIGFMNLASSTTPTFDYRMRLSGRSGPDDYLFEEPFLGRAETGNDFFNRQFIVTDAGFKSPTFFYRLADKWMTGINLTTTLPGIIPFRLFYNIGTFNDAKTSYIENRISWEGGIDLPLLKDILTVYLPLFYSDDINYVIDQRSLKKSDLIRFELRLTRLNPITALRNSYRR